MFICGENMVWKRQNEVRKRLFNVWLRCVRLRIQLFCSVIQVIVRWFVANL